MDSKYLAIYFRMGNYEETDGIPALVGFDCPFDDSFVVEAQNEQELEKMVRGLYDGTTYYDKHHPNTIGEPLDDPRGINPDIIVDSQGDIQVELYQGICDCPDFNPDKISYSFGRETLTEFWAREKDKWIV